MTHPEPPLAGDETATRLGSLERVRSWEWKCGGLDAAGLQVKIATSSPDTSATPTSSGNRSTGSSGRIHRMTGQAALNARHRESQKLSGRT